MEVKINPSEENQRHLHIWQGDLYIKKVDKILFKRHLAQIRKMTNIQQEIEILEKKVAYSYLLYLLSRQSYSNHELKKKLSSRLFSSESIAYVLDKASCYICEEELMNSIIRIEVSKGKGERVIVEKLAYRLGLQREEVADMVREKYSSETQERKAIEIVKKKFKGEIDQAKKVKALRFLVSRGFSYQIASIAMLRSQHDLDSEEMG